MRLGATTAVGDKLGDIAGIIADQPGEVEHFAKWQAAKIKLETRHHHVVACLQQPLCEKKEVLNKLALIDSHTFDPLADLLFCTGENRQHRPRISGAEFNSFHLSATVSVSAFDQPGRCFGVIAWFQKHDVLFCVLSSYLNPAQQFSGLVAAHGSNDEFQFPWHTSLQHLQTSF